jgi:predicted nucleotidyltransferase
MGKKTYRKRTPEEQAEYDYWTERTKKRIAERLEEERRMEELATLKAASRLNRFRLWIARIVAP